MVGFLCQPKVYTEIRHLCVYIYIYMYMGWGSGRPPSALTIRAARRADSSGAGALPAHFESCGSQHRPAALRRRLTQAPTSVRASPHSRHAEEAPHRGCLTAPPSPRAPDFGSSLTAAQSFSRSTPALAGPTASTRSSPRFNAHKFFAFLGFF